MLQQKHEQFLDVFREEIAALIPRLVDLEANQFIIVNRLVLEQNMNLLHIFVTVFPEEQENDILIQLKNSRFEILKELQKRFAHRRIPSKLLFDIDRQAKYAKEVDEILDHIS